MTDARIFILRRIDQLKKHKHVISPHTGDCWQCRAYKRYRQDAEDRRARGVGGGRKHQRTKRT